MAFGDLAFGVEFRHQTHYNDKNILDNGNDTDQKQ
jgi:hypothetical protein